MVFIVLIVFLLNVVDLLGGIQSETGSLLAGVPSLQVIDDMLRNCN